MILQQDAALHRDAHAVGHTSLYHFDCPALCILKPTTCRSRHFSSKYTKVYSCLKISLKEELLKVLNGKMFTCEHTGTYTYLLLESGGPYSSFYCLISNIRSHIQLVLDKCYSWKYMCIFKSALAHMNLHAVYLCRILLFFLITSIALMILIYTYISIYF